MNKKRIFVPVLALSAALLAGLTAAEAGELTETGGYEAAAASENAAEGADAENELTELQDYGPTPLSPDGAESMAESVAEEPELLVEYDYEDITVGNPTPLNGQFFTALWGNDTSDIDVRHLVSGYNLVTWDSNETMFRFDKSVVSGAVINDDEEGNRTYQLMLYDDLYFSDGTPVTAYDYAFSVLLQCDPVIGELGGNPVSYDYLLGYEAYASGESDVLTGLRVPDEHRITFVVRAEALPYFYELDRLAFYPYPISAIAPGCTVTDDGTGTRIANEDASLAEPIFTEELLRETILDPSDGYMVHPDPGSGPYRIVSYDGTSARFEINTWYKGNEDGFKPRIAAITLTEADNDTMIEDMRAGKYALINKAAFADNIRDGLTLCVEEEQFTRTVYPRIGLTYLLCSPESTLLDQQNVRQAIAYCLDKPQFVRDYVGPYGLSVDGLLGLGQWMYQTAMGSREYPVKAVEDPTEEDEQTYEDELAAWEEISLDGLMNYDLDTAGANTNSNTNTAVSSTNNSGGEDDGEAAGDGTDPDSDDAGTGSGQAEADGDDEGAGNAAYSEDIAEAVRLLEEAGWTLNEEGGDFDPSVDTVRCRETEEGLVPLALRLGYRSTATLDEAFSKDFTARLAEAGIALEVVPLEFDSVVEAHNEHLFEMADLLYFGDNFSVSFDPALFFKDEEGDTAEDTGEEITAGRDGIDTLRAAYQEVFELSEEMDRTEPTDLLAYEQKWVAFQTRLSELLPAIPVYTNVYFDFYTGELHNYWIDEYESWGDAIVPARMYSLTPSDETAELEAELNYLDEDDPNLGEFIKTQQEGKADTGTGALQKFPEDVRSQIPEEYNTINEFTSSSMDGDVGNIASATVNYGFQTLYAPGEKVYVLFGVMSKGTTHWIVQEGTGLEDGAVSVVLDHEQLEQLSGRTFAVAVVSQG